MYMYIHQLHQLVQSQILITGQRSMEACDEHFPNPIESLYHQQDMLLYKGMN